MLFIFLLFFIYIVYISVVFLLSKHYIKFKQLFTALCRIDDPTLATNLLLSHCHSCLILILGYSTSFYCLTCYPNSFVDKIVNSIPSFYHPFSNLHTSFIRLHSSQQYY